jgi:hypothetical protein
MNRSLIAVGVVVALAACSKAPEKAAEKMVESQLSKDGTQAKVDLSEGGMKITATDAAGKTTQMEMGNAKVSEAEIGLPFYPGTQAREGGTRISSPDGTMLSISLHSDDAPDKVAGFYREKLKAQAEGKQYTEMSGDGSHTLMLADDKTRQMTQVMVAKAEGKGSEIQITAHRASK